MLNLGLLFSWVKKKPKDFPIDQKTMFVSKLVQDLCQLLHSANQVKKLHTLVYNPQGLLECFNERVHAPAGGRWRRVRLGPTTPYMFFLCFWNLQSEKLPNIREHVQAAQRKQHLSLTDHKSVLVVPAYKPRLKQARATWIHIRVWQDGAASTLQVCFGCTG